jgi:hypothetical protein
MVDFSTLSKIDAGVRFVLKAVAAVPAEEVEPLEPPPPVNPPSNGAAHPVSAKIEINVIISRMAIRFI